MRTLIIGGGVAGLTLAALLRQRGGSPVIVERARGFDRLGYMLGLYYLGTRVFHGLGLFRACMDRSVEMRCYEIRDGRGRLLRAYDLEQIARRFGPICGISRPVLIRLLLERVGDASVRLGTTVDSIDQRSDGVGVRFSDGPKEEFDLVVGADGLHSDTRRMLLSRQDTDFWETGWGGWVCWADADLANAHVYTECWGAGHFVGLYPTGRGLGVFCGGPVDLVRRLGPEGFIGRLRDWFGPGAHPVSDVLKSIQLPDKPFFWDFHDCRSRHWRSGRVVLLGDAAAGFLPTAGVGASMAMESAAALADVLGRTNAQRVEGALDLFVRRRRGRVEAAQTASRRMGRMMFIRSAALAWGRDQLVKRYSLRRLTKGIAGLMGEPV